MPTPNTELSVWHAAEMYHQHPFAFLQHTGFSVTQKGEGELNAGSRSLYRTTIDSKHRVQFQHHRPFFSCKMRTIQGTAGCATLYRG